MAEEIEDLYELSPVQQGLLFQSLYAPHSGIYCVQLSCLLGGNLDVRAFVRSWQQVVERHTILRTAFFWEEMNKPLQVVHRRVALPLEDQDWRGLSTIEQAARFEALLEADRTRGFELSTAPLMRLALIRTAEDSHRLIWSFHHLLLDGWSVSLLLKELFAVYDVAKQGRRLQLGPIRPFREYIVWLQQQDLSQAENFWRATLKGFSAPTSLGVGENSITTGESQSYREEKFKLSETTTNALRLLGRGHHLTINTLIQGAWALLLSRYSGEQEVVFGVTTAGRPSDLKDSDTILGLFINTLPARVQIPDAGPTLSWLKDLQEEQAEQRHYEYAPLTQVQKWADGARGEALFESILVFENYPVDDAVRERGSDHDLQITDITFHEQTEYPLTVVVVPGSELSLRLGYDSSRFSKSAIKRMAAHLQQLLNSILENPQQLIGDLQLLTAHEERQLVYEWNQTGREYAGQSLTEQFEAQVERSPAAVAVVFEGEEVSYRELNERANQLAHHLQSLGVGAETLVGIMMERSVEMVVSLLAVLKAGGAYVPLDPEYPSARLQFMLADAGVRVLLTQERLTGTVASGEAQVVCVDSKWDEISEQSRANPASTVSAENLAYVIYTSGSTGQPKGAMNTHGAIANRLAWMQEAYDLQGDDVVLQKTPFSFDVSVWEFFWSLLTGARLVVARPRAHRDPAYLRDLIIGQKVTTTHFVPSMLAAFLDEPRIEECRSLRRVICSGEALPLNLQERFFARFDSVELHNLYGPTEAAVDVTFWACERDSKRRNVPIGQPISNTEIYLLDKKMRIVPVGVRGELFIGGMGVGRGYLNHAELTAERYVPHPFSDERGARLYRTGDVCCRQEDGRIEYVGRKDYQVKVRGHRIELGEIEAALENCRGVKQCVVVAQADSGSEKRLLAYIVPGEEQVSVSEWREQLQKQLPDHMIPAVFLKLEELPLTPSGKVDRKALPAVTTGRPMLGSAYAAWCTPLEELLVAIWSEVLDVTPVGVLDNFFELGGDSIRSIQILARAKKAGITFSLQDLFKHPTIRELARVASIHEADQSEVDEIKEFSLISESDRQRLPVDVEDAYPLSQLQVGMIFHSEFSPATAIYHDIFAFHIRARFDADILQTVLRELLARHPVLRTSFDLTQFSEPLQMVHHSVAVPLQVDDLRGVSAEQQTQLLAAWKEKEKSRNFDWAQAPLIRAHVFLRSDNSFNFVLSFHHAVLDGWSVASMLAEIFFHYASLLRGESTPIQLTQPLAKFSDLVALERAAQESEECQEYWSEKLRESPFIKIPRWRFQSQTSKVQTRTHQVQICPELSLKLIEAAREASVTVKSVLLAAHLRVMKLLSGQSDVLTGLVSNGRPETTDGERVLGLFLNVLPFRLQVEGGTWAELLQATFEAEREMLPFRRYPMAQMQRERGRALFEAGFNFNHFHLFKSLPKFAEMEIIEGDFFEATNYVLTANFGLDVFSSEIHLTLFYNASELSEEQVIDYGNYYVRALEGIGNNASARYDRTSLLAVNEERQLVYEWNQTGREYAGHSVTEQFEAQVERSPAAVAVVFEGAEVSYRELNERANQLAHHLLSLGVGAEMLVGIMMERSVEMVVSLLAVLKAGGAYVPLDAEYPSARLQFMLADAGVRVLLTQERLTGTVASGEAQVVCVDSKWDEISEQSRANPASTVSAENLAYVIYTSGSTGNPNGVLIQHNSVSNLIQQAQAIFKVNSNSRVLHIASFSFDASVLELFLALCSGASLYLCSREQRLLPDEVNALVRREQLTTAVLTPSLLKVLEPEQCRSLRTISSGGERLTADVAERWSSAERRMLNCYGPTEATIFAAYGECAAKLERDPGIGRGVENVVVYVLDSAMAVVPIGVVGDLYLGGAGLARGYLGRADLTADRFVPDPYSVVAGARMYRTGDEVRWNRNGELEYVGRRDEQVKIRGQRVELTEVESVLRKQKGVRECAVVLRDLNGAESLIAYVVPQKSLSEQIELCPSAAEYFVYDDYLYDTLTHDERRNNKYRAVINRTVRNKVVLDIGTGPDAILARLCVEGGAKRVYAIEVLEQTYRRAEATIKSLGLEDRIVLLHADSMHAQLPEQVDVCVSEIVGSIGGAEGAAPIINNAHRWLKPEGVMIPECARTSVAAAMLPDELLENPGFSELGVNYAAKIFEQIGHPFDMRLCIRNFPESHLLSGSAIFEELNFTEQVATEYRREIRLDITRKGKMDGLLVWLNLRIGEGEEVNILEPGYSWFPIYFPVFYPGVEVDEGDAILAVCSGRPSDNGINPDYTVKGKLIRRDGSEIEFDYYSGHHESGYRQGAFHRLIFGEDGSIRKREQTEVTSQRLRTDLKKHLPDYMIPQSFLLLDELPLTPAGKIDRKSLPAPETIRSELERHRIAPRTSLERKLADIWTDLLGVQQISIHDSFFDLGGHSLLSTRFTSQLREMLDIEIPLHRFFEIPTIAMLAAEIENNGGPSVKETAIKSLSRQSRLMKRSELGAGNP